MQSSCIYYTDAQLDPKILLKCQQQLRKVFKGDIISCSLKPIDFGDTRIVLDLERGYLTMFKQILAALELVETDIVFHAEHDVLYPEEHFDFTPPTRDKFYYNQSWWKTRSDGLAVSWKAAQVSGLSYYTELGKKFYTERIKTFDPKTFDRKFEPTVHDGYEVWESKVPLVDIRHNNNTTFNKWHIQHFRKKDTAVEFQESTIDKIPGWNLTTKGIYG